MNDTDMGFLRACSLDIFLHDLMPFAAFFSVVVAAYRLGSRKVTSAARRRLRQVARYGLEEFTVACIDMKIKPLRLKWTSDSDSGPKEAPLCIKIAYR